MDGGRSPLAEIPLRDGSVLRVTPEGIGIGDRFFALSNLQDARQVAPDPETVALRVAGAGLVEFQPARPGDGALALEALFRLRPDLRPAGFAPPGAPAAAPQPPYAAYPPTFPSPYPPSTLYAPYYPPFPAMPGYPQYPQYPQPGMAPGAAPQPYYPPAGFAPPVFVPPFVPNPNTLQGELTPIPREFGQLLGAIFQLSGKHFPRFILLALCVVLPPVLLLGIIQTVFYVASSDQSLTFGTSATQSSQTTTSCINQQFPIFSVDQLVLGAGIAVALLVVLAMLGSWQTATLALGARDAVLGRRIAIGATLRAGLRRIPQTLGTQVLTQLILGLCLLPMIALATLAFAALLPYMRCNASIPSSQTSALFSAYLITGCAVTPFCFILYAYFKVRLGLAPYAAGMLPLGPGGAIAANWRLTRGNWWRTFFVLLLMSMIVQALTGLISWPASIYPPALYLVAVPVIELFVAPLHAITGVVLLSDLRLRSEGYPAATDDTTTSPGVAPKPRAADAPQPVPAERASPAAPGPQ